MAQQVYTTKSGCATGDSDNSRDNANCAYRCLKGNTNPGGRIRFLEVREISGTDNTTAAEARDIQKYGNADDPTFNELFGKNKAAGLSDDEAYQKIIESSKRTDPGSNQKYEQK